MTIDEFRERFGTSPERNALIDNLEQEMLAIKSKGWKFDVFAFGGLVNRGDPAPKDLDILLNISHAAGQKWQRLQADSQLDISLQELSGKFDPADPALAKTAPPLLGLAEMLKRFNENPANIKNGIKISAADCVEVSL